jgi:hypothetical protein
MVKENHLHNLTLKTYLIWILVKEALHSCGIRRRASPSMIKGMKFYGLVPYIVKKKSEKGTYYLSSMDGRRMPLPVDGSLL